MFDSYDSDEIPAFIRPHLSSLEIKELETWFSGFGLADIGFAAADLTPTIAVELDDAIANVYRDNLGDHCIIADVREYSNRMSDRIPFWFHVSPPCTNASVAKTDAGETELDIELAQAIVKGIERKPPWFSLENVWGYRNFESFRLICGALEVNGYNFDYWHLNSANYGVPQTRKRLILVASRVSRVVQPYPTHAKEPDLFLRPWIGWHGAIADLIPTLPETQFAKWQLERLSEELKTAWHPECPQSFLTETKFPNRNATRLWRSTDEPVGTVTALNPNLKAYLIDANNTIRGCTVRSATEPSPTVPSSWMRRPVSIPKAFLVGDQRSNNGVALALRNFDQPCYTVEASKSGDHAGRALLVDGIANSGGTTVTAVTGDRPAFTVKASAHKQASRAWVPEGRVVSITPRCIARFQSMPDDYRLTGKNSLDCKGIGNGFPCLLAQVLVEAQRF